MSQLFIPRHQVRKIHGNSLHHNAGFLVLGKLILDIFPLAFWSIMTNDRPPSTAKLTE
jgi:hypothetical protein